MTSIVFRKHPDMPHRQYVRGVVNGRHMQAAQVAHTLKARSVGKRGQAPTEPAGEYGVEQV